MQSQGMSHWIGVYDLDSVTQQIKTKSVYKLVLSEQIKACVALSPIPAPYYADCWPDAPMADWYLTMLAVMPDEQQSGFGSILLNFAKQQLTGGETLQLDAVAHYPELLRFYRKHGFTQLTSGIGLGDRRYLFGWSLSPSPNRLNMKPVD
ncbi:acetyltransferase [Methylophaga frappieri]|uniref:Acetyltransferase n=1 Tax=Methylophaga frappieri (strain ATCC BAA-2434 / DSM 25690 / JAM7) TaxID=754477 RepID=I1YEN7_METFJ|nr:GNAT family N-acetyltransferase [Methylophaga frappieri]AFJ01380.1 acetyltransferase [Methylophaga frappieri]